ncbi:DmpA family aminopeptidase [Jiulongibacter sp. NS-SX5]|uniref:DmpA family aminopeptidase n=1 Tax=Jiulongibacter sp. NS-SX5 TaxID=3463854 RepID=UPI00405867FB
MKKLNLFLLIITFLLSDNFCSAQNKRPREYGIEIGILKTGQLNAITDVKGVKVGHKTLQLGDSIRTGVTAILPFEGNIFQSKIPAAIYLGNGFGKLAGYSQVKELGNLETPIVLTNTLSVSAGIEGTVQYTLDQEGNENVRSVNAVVGETNDGYLNDIRGRHVRPEHVIEAIQTATTGKVEEGNVGAGTGTVCFGYKGGIGTSSRVIPEKLGGYTVGVLVQSNFGGVLNVNGVPIAKILDNYPRSYTYDVDGSCMIVVLTDAPLSPRNLERLAKRAMMGIGKIGGIASNGSGDYVIAASTYEANRVPYFSKDPILKIDDLHNDKLSPLFLATIEATEEAVLNSLFMAESSTGHKGHEVKELPENQVLEIYQKHFNVSE